MSEKRRNELVRAYELITGRKPVWNAKAARWTDEALPLYATHESLAVLLLELMYYECPGDMR